METTLFVIRHGQREDSESGGRTRPAARPCDPDITTVGIKQATEAGEALAPSGISVVYSSPFLRTARTAAMIAGQCGVKVRLEWGLAEWFRSDWWKEWPGTIHPDALGPMLGGVVEHHPPTGVMPEIGEDDFWKASERYVKTARLLADRHRGEKIALVTHGPALVCIAAGLLSSWDEPGIGNHRQCGITELVLDSSSKWRAARLNDVSHLSHVET